MLSYTGVVSDCMCLVQVSYLIVSCTGVMSALKDLQQRIKQIEREKQQAQSNLSNLKYDAAVNTEATQLKSPSVNVSSGILGDTTVTSGSVPSEQTCFKCP